MFEGRNCFECGQSCCDSLSVPPFSRARRNVGINAPNEPPLAQVTSGKGRQDMTVIGLHAQTQAPDTRASNEGYLKVREDFTNTEKASTRAFFWLKAPTIKTLYY